jgi:uncharacterized protein DUF4838
MSFKNVFVRVIGIMLLFAATKSVCENDKLIDKKYFHSAIPGKSPRLFWWPRSANISFKNGTAELKAGQKKQESCSFRVNIENEIASALKLTFSSRITNGKGICSITVCGKDKGHLKRPTLKSARVKLKAHDWKQASITIPMFDNVATTNINFKIIGPRATFQIKNVSLKLIKKKSNESSVISIQNGRKIVNCSGIYIAKSKPYYEFYDKKAAKLLRKYLYLTTGKILPLKYVSDAKKELKPGIILIGQAARESGLIRQSILDGLKSGGYAVNANNGIVTLAGKSPSGVMSGTYALLEMLLHTRFITENLTKPEITKRSKLIFKKTAFSESPAFELRFLKDTDAMIGYTDPAYIGNAKIIGCPGATTCHTAPGLIEFDKYHKIHPEYFALGKDGKRLYRNPTRHRFDVHLCMSNPEVQKLVAKQIVAWMTANPQAKFFYISPGDGGEQYCRCANCKAMDEKKGVISDRNLKFINSIAKVTAKTHPEKILMTLAYVDLETPPVKTKPASNVRVLYCPYPRSWSNHLEAFDKRYNSKGIKTLNGWLKFCPQNIYIFGYPSNCAEALNVWPAFYANYEKIVFYAKHGIKGIVFCGMYRQRGGYFGYNSFNAMSRFVFSKVLWNPGLDVEKEIDLFMKLYYGPAAPYMRRFFNLVHQDVKKRHFVQHIEEAKRGLFTKSLAAKSYAIFTKAERAVRKQPEYLDRVLREKVYLFFTDLSDRNRSNGKIKEKEIPVYAKKLAQFAQLCKKFHISYFARRRTPEKWFWETALLKISPPSKRNWQKSPQITNLINNPLGTIKKSMTNCQDKIKNGWRIPMFGLAGGLVLRKYFYKCPAKKNVRLLQRSSSGNGYVRTTLVIDSIPKASMQLELEGIDNDKRNKALMALLINGRRIYKGKVPFAKNKWTCRTFKIPDGLLRKGKNSIEFKNITPDIVTNEEKRNVDFIIGRKKNYQWGWFILSGLEVITSN